MRYLHVGAVAVDNLERLVYGGFAQVPILVPVKRPQLVLQGNNIDVLIVVKMAEPPANRT